MQRVVIVGIAVIATYAVMATAGVVAAPAGQAQFVACGAVRAYYSDHGTSQYVQASRIKASGLGCQRARHVAYEWSSHSRLSGNPATSGASFACAYNRVGSDVGITRCTNGARVVRFNAYDSSPFH